MRNQIAIGVVLLAAIVVPGIALGSEDGSAVQDLLHVLRERNVITEDQYQEIAGKNASYEENVESKLPPLTFWGDFRARYEGFWYDEDETGSERSNRSRGRYRLRLNGKAEINDHASVLFRLASGNTDNRSTNQTLGSTLDFDSDPIVIDRAYVHLTPFAGGKLGERPGKWAFEIGKVPNPYRWKVGKDFMLWDGDINFEGVSMLLQTELTESVMAFANTGYYILDENSTSKDPHLYAAQVGAHAETSDVTKAGARLSYYHFDSLNDAFFIRAADSGAGASATSGGGNIRDGLTGGSNQDLQVIEAGAYFSWMGCEAWPVTVYGNFSHNFTAEDSTLFPIADEDDNAWGVGIEVGNKKKYAKLGVGYWHVEANAFPSQFIDSDLFDGRTNREGWAFYGSRTMLKNTDLNLTVFVSDEIEQEVPPFGESVPNAERVRLQADLVFKFK